MTKAMCRFGPEDVFTTERHPLYVAWLVWLVVKALPCRLRDQLFLAFNRSHPACATPTAKAASWASLHR
jgi:hypothetical protein